MESALGTPPSCIATSSFSKVEVEFEEMRVAKKIVNYLGHIVGNGEIRIDPSKVSVLREWPPSTTQTELRSCIEATQYLQEFIRDYSGIAAPLLRMLAKDRPLTWGSLEQKAFAELKDKICQAPVLALPDMQQPFEVETDASSHAMGAILLQGGKPMCYHSELFSGAVQNYPTYDKELYAMWRHYLWGKEMVIHTDHKPLKYLQKQSKLQQTRHLKWMGYLQQYQLVIKYKKGTTNKLADFLSRPPSKIVAVVMQVEPARFNSYKDLHRNEDDFKKHFDTVNKFEEGKQGYHMDNGLLFEEDKLCIPKDHRLPLIREAHTSLLAGHFGIHKIVANLQRYVYWPNMVPKVEWYVKRCTVCNTSKPNNKKLALYIPLPVPSRPWESISMDFLRGLSTTKKGNNYIFVIVDRFSKMAIMIPCR